MHAFGSNETTDVPRLKAAIDANDVDTVIALMTRNPALHQAPLGYKNNGALTWVAECRVPWQAPTRQRLLMAEWMIDHGSDLHQGGDGPLMRAALVDDRIPMMELLVARGADVNALWGGYFPILFAPCETLQPRSIAWLVARGADPNVRGRNQYAQRRPLDYVIVTYSRSRRLAACVEALRAAGAQTRYDCPAVLDLMCGNLAALSGRIDDEPDLAHRRFPELDFGSTARRRLLLAGGTLLHVAAEYGDADAANLLLDRGADVNAAAATGDGRVGQTPLFHAVSQFDDYGYDVAQVLIQRGADLTRRLRLPGHYERPDEFVDATPLEYAGLFPGQGNERTIALLRRARSVLPERNHRIDA